MLNKKQLEEETQFVGTLKMLAQSYEEVAVIKMQRVRSSVLSTREFIDELSEVFADLKTSYKHQVEDFMKQKKKDKHHKSFTTFNKNGKKVVVYISSNDKLYGDIVNKVFRLFMEHLRSDDSRKAPPEVVIVGKSGKTLYEQQHDVPTFSYFDLPDSNVKIEQLKPIVEKLIQYENINVFYGKFVNVMTQDATSEDISGQQEIATDKDGTHKVKYFFEPSLDKILQFFESQVFTSLFSQTIHETELARLASRIRSMEEALGNIEKSESQLKGAGHRLRRSMSNKKQLEGLAGISLLK